MSIQQSECQRADAEDSPDGRTDFSSINKLYSCVRDAVHVCIYTAEGVARAELRAYKPHPFVLTVTVTSY